MMMMMMMMAYSSRYNPKGQIRVWKTQKQLANAVTNNLKVPLAHSSSSSSSSGNNNRSLMVEYKYNNNNNNNI
jgi:hypothetical protein